MQQRRLRRLETLALSSRQLPISFSVVGVQKAATSTLYKMLTRHREVAGGHEKEIRFFMEEARDWDDPDYSTYCRPAEHPAVRVAGDATPAYIFWPRALERMHRYNPGMRLIATFRDPVERAFSEWSMQRTRDAGFPDLPEAVRRFSARHVPNEISRESPPYEVRRQALVTRGLYGQQLERGLRHFPREQWLLIGFRDFLTHHTSTLDRVTDHIGVHRYRRYPGLQHRGATASGHAGRPPSADDVRHLVELYADDLALFARLSGLDVSRWPTTRVLSGDLDVAEFSDLLSRKLGLGS